MPSSSFHKKVPRCRYSAPPQYSSLFTWRDDKSIDGSSFARATKQIKNSRWTAMQTWHAVHNINSTAVTLYACVIYDCAQAHSNLYRCNLYIYIIVYTNLVDPADYWSSRPYQFRSASVKVSMRSQRWLWTGSIHEFNWVGFGWVWSKISRFCWVGSK